MSSKHAKAASQQKPGLDAHIVFCATAESVEDALAVLSTLQIMFMDCEGVELGVLGGSLSILSLGGMPLNSPKSLHIYLIDVCHLPLDCLRPVFDLLSCPNVVKVVWDGRMDYSALYHDKGVQTRNVIDLQIIDILSRRSRDSPEQHLKRFHGYVEGRILEHDDAKERYAHVDKLNSLAGAIQEHKPVGRKRFKKMKVDHQVWDTLRPLPDEYIKYAAMDIEMIAALYQVFLSCSYIDPNDLATLSAKFSRYVAFWEEDQPPIPTRANPFIGNAFLPLELVDDLSNEMILDADNSKPINDVVKCEKCSRHLTQASFPLRAPHQQPPSCWVCIAVEENVGHWESRKKAAEQRISRRNAKAKTKPTTGKRQTRKKRNGKGAK